MNKTDWETEGESLIRAIADGHTGLTYALVFRLGMWWADRPWKEVRK